MVRRTYGIQRYFKIANKTLCSKTVFFLAFLRFLCYILIIIFIARLFLMPRCTDAGFQDDINDLLDSLIDGPGYLKEQNVPLTELFCEAFMKKYTDVPTFDAFLSLGGFTAQSPHDLDAIPDSELDKLAAEHTQFDTWAEMHSQAAKIYLDKN